MMGHNKKKNHTPPAADNSSDNEDIIFEEDGSEEEVKNISKLKKTLADCRKEKQEYLDGWQRARAELINYKRDDSKRFEKARQDATEDITHDILPVLDSFDIALQHTMPKEVEQGIVMIQSQLEAVLERRGIVPMATKNGDPFDSARHESIGEVASDQQEGTIVEVVQKGYTLHDKVLRAARVKVAKSQ